MDKKIQTLQEIIQAYKGIVKVMQEKQATNKPALMPALMYCTDVRFLLDFIKDQAELINQLTVKEGSDVQKTRVEEASEGGSTGIVQP